MIEIRYDKMETTSATRRAYNEIYQGEGILHRDSFYLWLIELLNPKQGATLLDISCGEGRLVTLAAEQKLEAHGVDFSFDGVARGSSETPTAGWAVGDGECLPYASNSMDYVTHIGSLEHYQNLSLGASEIGRVLKRGGKACILVPNAFGLLGNVRHVYKTGEIFDDGMQPIQRYATRGTWADLLVANGLVVEQVLGYGEIERPRTSEDRRWMVSHPVKIAKLVITSLIPTNLKNHLVYICTAK